MAIDAQALCDHLDQLVGQKVAEVIIRQHEYRLGRKDAEEFSRLRAHATVREILDVAEKEDLLSGVGVTKIALDTETPRPGQPILCEIFNPCVKGTSGAGKAILSSYWAGLISHLLGRECESHSETYDEEEQRLRFRIVASG